LSRLESDEGGANILFQQNTRDGSSLQNQESTLQQKKNSSGFNRQATNKQAS